MRKGDGVTMRRTCSSSGAGVPSGRGLLGCGRVLTLALVAFAVAPLLTVAAPPTIALPVVRVADAAVFVGLLLPPPQAAKSAPTALAAATRSTVRRCMAACWFSDD